MHHAVDAGHDVHKSPVGLYPYNGSRVDFSDLDIFGHPLHFGECTFCAQPFAGDIDGAIFFDIDFDAIIFLQTAHGFAAGSNQFPDLFWVDPVGQDAWGIFAQAFACLWQHREHLLHDIQAPCARLVERPAQDLKVQPFDLEIHLQCCDAVCCACNLEVHIAQRIFHALDIAEHLVFSALHVLDQPHGNSGHRCCNRDAGIHQRQGAAAD